MNQEPAFRCPSCGNTTDLRVECSIICRVIQTEDNFETEPLDQSEWYFDRDSFMYCAACDFNGEVRDFEVPT